MAITGTMPLLPRLVPALRTSRTLVIRATGRERSLITATMIPQHRKFAHPARRVLEGCKLIGSGSPSSRAAHLAETSVGLLRVRPRGSLQCAAQSICVVSCRRGSMGQSGEVGWCFVLHQHVRVHAGRSPVPC